MSCDIHSTTCELYSVAGNRLIEQCFKVLNPLLIACAAVQICMCFCSRQLSTICSISIIKYTQFRLNSTSKH